MRAYCIATKMPSKLIGVRSTLISWIAEVKLIRDRSN
jgi:hypothetical protein